MSRHRTLCKIVLAAALLGGCATGTRIAAFGPLSDGSHLVTLIVSEDLEVVQRECVSPSTPRITSASSRVLGCQRSRPVVTPDVLPVRAMTIVRFADTLPSAVTFEIDAHELCHAVAALQLLAFDPCHTGNGGMLPQDLASSVR